MMYLKSCPRCKAGDLYIEKDWFGPYVLCLQCGYMKDIKEPAKPTPASTQAKPQKEPVTAGR